jgi:D-tyrosyl-tRNA(Tyr) deacylase
MKAVVQRVKSASVSVHGTVVGAIDHGLLVFLGVCLEDTEAQALQLSRKVAKLRIFADDKAPMNVDVQAVGGDILVVSQFTLHAQTKKGNRPSFTEAAPGAQAEPLYLKFIESLRQETNRVIQTGRFGADMGVTLVNDGPVTIILDTDQY